MTHCITPPVAMRGQRLPLSPREEQLYSVVCRTGGTQLEMAQAMGYSDRCGAFRRLLAGLKEKGWM